ncbi:MAG: LysR family transcriptional regulator, partial [Gammaproteobacteria bacterium]|nr:LysR family transcriptional regulator [Gammaproteobacteria bacterium]
HGQPQALTDISRMPTLSMRTVGTEHSWRFVDADSKPAELIHVPCLSTDDLHTLRRAAIQGVGVACLPTVFIADDLSSGELVRLLPSLSARAGVVHAVFPSRRGMVPAVRALLDSLSDGFAANPLLRGE